MQILHTIDELRAARAALAGTVALVPTMGYLHRGHLSLMARALEEADHLIVTIFVNPRQFGPSEDLDNYPRDEAGEIAACKKAGCTLLFMPPPEEIYPPEYSTEVIVHTLGDHLCGSSRPGHFEGVTTVVSKLFNLTQPHLAVFGQKDYQQLAIIRRMVRDLNFPVRIIAGPTVREADGLAMSSRNRYLQPEERLRAAALNQALRQAHRAFQEGLRDPDALIALAAATLEAAQVGTIDYIQCVHPDSLQPFLSEGIEDTGALLALAVHVGAARLIDNLRLDQPLPPGLPPEPR